MVERRCQRVGYTKAAVKEKKTANTGKQNDTFG